MTSRFFKLDQRRLVTDAYVSVTGHDGVQRDVDIGIHSPEPFASIGRHLARSRQTGALRRGTAPRISRAKAAVGVVVAAGHGPDGLARYVLGLVV